MSGGFFDYGLQIDARVCVSRECPPFHFVRLAEIISARTLGC